MRRFIVFVFGTLFGGLLTLALRHPNKVRKNLAGIQRKAKSIGKKVKQSRTKTE